MKMKLQNTFGKFGIGLFEPPSFSKVRTIGACNCVWKHMMEYWLLLLHININQFCQSSL